MATVFSRTTTTYDPNTGATSTSTTTVSGNALKVRGRPDVYRQLSLIESQAPTLFFTPMTYGQTPEPGDTVQFPVNGPTYTVRDVDTIAPDGVVIAARVVVTR